MVQDDLLAIHSRAEDDPGPRLGVFDRRVDLAPRPDDDRSAARQGLGGARAIAAELIELSIRMAVTVGDRDGVRHPIDPRGQCQGGWTIPDLQGLGARNQAMPGPPQAAPPCRGVATSVA